MTPDPGAAGGPPAPPRPPGLTLARVLYLVAAALAGAVAFLYFASDRLPSLDGARLAAARGRWQTAGPASYRLRLQMEGSELERGDYEVEVERGTLTRAVRNGQPITGDASAYSVDGLFQLLAQELAMADDPGTAGQAPPGYHVYLFAEFAADTGLPRRFRRVVGGSSRWVEWRVGELEAR